MNLIMGNDEFILHIRKKSNRSKYDNDYLGKIIWENIKTLDPDAVIIEKDQKCFWGSEGENINARMLPKTATQFKFNMAILVRIYEFIDGIE